MGTAASASTAVVSKQSSTLAITNLSKNNNDKSNKNTKQPKNAPSSNKNNNNPLFKFDMEKLEKSRWWRACAAGSIAGLTEHTLLYPIDTVKTRMQAVLLSHTETQYKSFIDAFSQIVRNEGASRLFRGLPTILTAAIPSHAAYFGAYEYSKYKLNAIGRNHHHPFLIAISGAIAACAHDAIVTPFDVIKQRMQLKNCRYPNVCSCAIETLKYEGYLSFFRSYPTTVLLNIPTFSTNFVIYESSKIGLKGSVLENEEYWLHHLLAGGIAGGIAGLVSNPLDVIKTSIQTDTSYGYKSISKTVKKIMRRHPNNKYRIFFSGAAARSAYMIPSAAITWTTYEAMKSYFGFPIDDIPII